MAALLTVLFRWSPAVAGSPHWTALDRGLALAAISLSDAPDDTLVVLRIDPRGYTFQVVYDDTSTVKHHGERHGALIAVNGGYFEEDYSPSGLVITDSRRFGRLNGFSGIFLVRDGRPEVRYLRPIRKEIAQAISGGRVTHAIQSNPTIVEPGGRPGILKDDGRQARRTAIGVDRSQNILMMVTKGYHFTLYTLMETILSSDLDCNTAINLDGGASTGLYISLPHFEYHIPSQWKVPGAIVVTKKQ